MQEVKNLCAVCNNIAKQRCTGCQAIHYCSQEHQKSDWKNHSKNCRAYKLVENSQLGRHYIATRNIKVGETVIYDTAPLITAPNYMKVTKLEDGNFFVSLKAPPVCLSCYAELTACNAKPCDKCGWPLCLICTRHGTECEFTKKHRNSKVNISSGEYGQPHPAYEIIGVIRALALRENNPKSYRKLMNHQDLSTMLIGGLEGSIRKAAQFAKTFLKINDVQEAEIVKIIGIILVNSYSVITTNDVYAAVYDQSSYIEHSCRANCSQTITDEVGIIFWAAVPISKGDHITTCYVKPFLGTKERRSCLSTVKFFDCICERCKDPTEFGTMFNAIKCTNLNCNGYALPSTFLVTGRNYPDFVCRKCNRTVPRKISDAMEESIRREKANLKTEQQHRNFIEKWSEHLHKNNSYIFGVERDMVFALAFTIAYLDKKPKEYYEDIEKLCVKLTELLKILAPAEYTMRATVLYLKAVTTGFSEEFRTIGEQLANAKIMKKDLVEVEQLLRREPACHSFEYTMLQDCRAQLATLTFFEKIAL